MARVFAGVRASPNTRYILLQIYEMDIDTRALRKLSFPDRLPAVNPDPRHAPDSLSTVVFAPDMNSFVFVVRGGPSTAEYGSALWSSNITGTDVHLLGSGILLQGASGAAAAQNLPVPTSSLAATGLTFLSYHPRFPRMAKH